ncbi:MAG: hypothetical protein WC829_04355 [Hyphomicrobium sp.]
MAFRYGRSVGEQVAHAVAGDGNERAFQLGAVDEQQFDVLAMDGAHGGGRGLAEHGLAATGRAPQHDAPGRCHAVVLVQLAVRRRGFHRLLQLGARAVVADDVGPLRGVGVGDQVTLDGGAQLFEGRLGGFGFLALGVGSRRAADALVFAVVGDERAVVAVADAAGLVAAAAADRVLVLVFLLRGLVAPQHVVSHFVVLKLRVVSRGGHSGSFRFAVRRFESVAPAQGRLRGEPCHGQAGRARRQTIRARVIGTVRAPVISRACVLRKTARRWRVTGFISVPFRAGGRIRWSGAPAG